jgi:carboxyl-terminal processing protease
MKGFMARAQPAPPPELFHELVLFGNVVSISDKQHVTPVDDPRAIRAAIAGFLQSLDPQSDYIPPDDFQNEFHGGGGAGSLGLTLRRDQDRIVVIRAQDGSPAAAAGVLPDDEIIAVDGHRVLGLPLSTVSEQLRGPVGQAATLTVVRGERAFKVTAVKQMVTQRSASFELKSGYGRVKISALDKSAEAEVRKALQAFEAASPKPKGVVLDLRACPGGLLDSAVTVAGLFVGKQDILTEHGRRDADVERYAYNGADSYPDIPLVVLVDADTGAGCEVIAGALQDHHRARIVGTPTSGKGSVQTVIPLNGGKDGAIRLTTAYLFRPSGKPIDGGGITPDLIIEQGAATSSNEDVQLNGAIIAAAPP